MGLDSVELLMEVENAFGIITPNHIADLMISVGDMYDFFWTKIRDRQRSNCLPQLVFYRLRKHFRLQLKIPDDVLIKPDSLLEEIIPLTNRFELYQQMKDSCEYTLPEWRVTARKELLFLKVPRIFAQKVIVIKESTMRELTLKVIDLNYQKPIRRTMNRLLVEEMINYVLVEKLAINPADISREKEFVKDFGID